MSPELRGRPGRPARPKRRARPRTRRPDADPEYAAAIADLRRIPGVGVSIADDLWRLGVRRVEQLRERSPDELYGRFCALVGGPVDRCLLYVFRCAVYFARTPDPETELLKWWNWKDGAIGAIVADVPSW